MKLIFFITFTLIVLTITYSVKTGKSSIPLEPVQDEWLIWNIGTHQYIVISSYQGKAICHYEDCNNSIHSDK